MCTNVMHKVNKRFNHANFGKCTAVICSVTCQNCSRFMKLSLLESSSRKEGV